MLFYLKIFNLLLKNKQCFNWFFLLQLSSLKPLSSGKDEAVFLMHFVAMGINNKVLWLLNGKLRLVLPAIYIRKFITETALFYPLIHHDPKILLGTEKCAIISVTAELQESLPRCHNLTV